MDAMAKSARSKDPEKAADRTSLPIRTLNGGGIKGNTGIESPAQFSGHDGDVFLDSVNVTECQTDKAYIFFSRNDSV